MAALNEEIMPSVQKSLINIPRETDRAEAQLNTSNLLAHFNPSFFFGKSKKDIDGPGSADDLLPKDELAEKHGEDEGLYYLPNLGERVVNSHRFKLEMFANLSLFASTKTEEPTEEQNTL